MVTGLTRQLVGQLRNDTTEFSTSSLPEVTDPEATYAGITRQDYENYVRDFRSFEEDLIDAKDDTSLIDQASVDATNQARIAREIQQRNIERYGGAGLTAVQRQEQAKALNLGGAINRTGLLNNARIGQREVNQATLADLINIGQGVNRNAVSGLGDASAMAANKRNAYANAKASHKNQMTSLGGSLASAAILAFAI
jgi:hypothetical protein